MELEGKRILLSGATGGLGRAIAEELADRGAKLVLSSRKQQDLRELARSRPTSAGGFSAIRGVGQKKLEDLGPTFLASIKAYCDANGVTLGM